MPLPLANWMSSGRASSQGSAARSATSVAGDLRGHQVAPREPPRPTVHQDATGHGRQQQPPRHRQPLRRGPRMKRRNEHLDVSRQPRDQVPEEPDRHDGQAQHGMGPDRGRVEPARRGRIGQEKAAQQQQQSAGQQDHVRRPEEDPAPHVEPARRQDRRREDERRPGVPVMDAAGPEPAGHLAAQQRPVGPRAGVQAEARQDQHQRARHQEPVQPAEQERIDCRAGVLGKRCGGG